MTLSAIQEQLQTELAAVAGVKTVYRNRPDVAPAAADCPAILLDRRAPFLTLSRPAVGVVRYRWHFKIRFLHSPLGLDTELAREAAVESFPLLCVSQLFSSTTLAGKASGLAPDMELKMGEISFGVCHYFGFDLDLDVYEDLSTTMGR
jgi:hypothetical protein